MTFLLKGFLKLNLKVLLSLRGAKTPKLESTSTEKDGAKTGGAVIYNESNCFKLVRVTIPESLEEFFISQS